jgi:hypothetical protein
MVGGRIPKRVFSQIKNRVSASPSSGFGPHLPDKVAEETSEHTAVCDFRPTRAAETPHCSWALRDQTSDPEGLPETNSSRKRPGPQSPGSSRPRRARSRSVIIPAFGGQLSGSVGFDKPRLTLHFARVSMGDHTYELIGLAMPREAIVKRFTRRGVLFCGH